MEHQCALQQEEDMWDSTRADQVKSIAGQGPDVDVDKSLRAFQFESSKHDHDCHMPPPIGSLSIINYIGHSKVKPKLLLRGQKTNFWFCSLKAWGIVQVSLSKMTNSLRQIVSWCAETIPKMVKISRPINGVKKSEINFFLMYIYHK